MPPAMRGIVAMLVSTVLFSAMHAAIRHVSQDIPPIQAAFFRNFFGLFVFLPILMRSGLTVFHTDRIGLHLVRAVLNVCAMFAFFTGLSMTPIASKRLVEAAVKDARAEGFKIIPLCPFAKATLERTPEWQDVVQ